MFIFEQIRTGGDRNFGYLIGDREAAEAVVVDPSYDPGPLVERARAQGLRITHILNTHGHRDHTNGNGRVQKLTGALVGAHTAAPSRPDLAIEDGQELAVGELILRFLHTPGHAGDHLCIQVDEVCLTGDLLFVGKVGGTPDRRSAEIEHRSLRQLLSKLPDHTTVWPGHDYGCRPSSTVGLEKRTNPFLLCPDFESFYTLKTEWARFKVEKGLV